MKKIYDLAVKTGTYQKNGETKGRYTNVGSVMEGDNGQFIILDRTFNPAGVPNPDNKSSVIVSMFAPREDGGKKADPANDQSFPANPDTASPFNDEACPF